MRREVELQSWSGKKRVGPRRVAGQMKRRRANYKVMAPIDVYRITSSDGSLHSLCRYPEGLACLKSLAFTEIVRVAEFQAESQEPVAKVKEISSQLWRECGGFRREYAIAPDHPAGKALSE